MARQMKTLTILGKQYEIVDATARSNIETLRNDVTQIIDDSLIPFTGATASANGTSGQVPVPKAGEQGKFLKGDGTWCEVADVSLTQTVSSLSSDFNGHTNNKDNPHGVTYSQVGAAASNHTHSYAGSSTAGGTATSANKVTNALTIKLNSGTAEGTNSFTFDGSATKTVNITPSGIGAAASSHGTHVTYGTSATALGVSSAGSAATVSRSDHVHAVPALSSCTGILPTTKGGTGINATDLTDLKTQLGLNVVVSTDEPENPVEGLIWLEILS